ncbi:MAG: hypothetical protein ACUVRV_06565 [Cyanobacteriota bacterium]
MDRVGGWVLGSRTQPAQTESFQLSSPIVGRILKFPVLLPDPQLLVWM